jgi:hypothetical protein
LKESEFTKGFERFDAVRAKYRSEPWYKDVHGNYTYLLVPYNEAELRDKGRAYIFGTPFRYDPMPTLRAVDAPQLWILGADDLQSPSAGLVAASRRSAPKAAPSAWQYSPVPSTG